MTTFRLPLGAQNKLRKAEQLVDLAMRTGNTAEQLHTQSNGTVIGRLFGLGNSDYAEPPSISPDEIAAVRASGEKQYRPIDAKARDFWPIPRMDQDIQPIVMPETVLAALDSNKAHAAPWARRLLSSFSIINNNLVERARGLSKASVSFFIQIEVTDGRRTGLVGVRRDGTIVGQWAAEIDRFSDGLSLSREDIVSVRFVRASMLGHFLTGKWVNLKWP